MSRKLAAPQPRPPQRPRPTQEQRRARTSAKVLDAAGHVFAERGYHGATLDEIAERAGLSKGAVYYNFDSKEALFLALLEQRLEHRLGDVGTAYRREGSAAATRHAGRDFLTRLERDPRWAPLFFEFVAHAARNDAVRKQFAEGFMATARQELARMIEQVADAEGVKLTISAEELAIATSALANGMLIERLFDRDVSGDLLGRMLTLIMRGLASAPPERR